MRGLRRRREAYADDGEAYADDVNLMMPPKEESIREVISVLDKFEKISGLKVNKDKTQVMRIGRSASSDPVLCSDLGLKWVPKLEGVRHPKFRL